MAKKKSDQHKETSAKATQDNGHRSEPLPGRNPSKAFLTALDAVAQMRDGKKKDK
jgi:hypothetical protein